MKVIVAGSRNINDYKLVVDVSDVWNFVDSDLF